MLCCGRAWREPETEHRRLVTDELGCSGPSATRSGWRSSCRTSLPSRSGRTESPCGPTCSRTMTRRHTGQTWRASRTTGVSRARAVRPVAPLDGPGAVRPGAQLSRRRGRRGRGVLYVPAAQGGRPGPRLGRQPRGAAPLAASRDRARAAPPYLSEVHARGFRRAGLGVDGENTTARCGCTSVPACMSRAAGTSSRRPSVTENALRPATVDDAPAIAELCNALTLGTFTPRRPTPTRPRSPSRFSLPDITMYVVEHDGPRRSATGCRAASMRARGSTSTSASIRTPAGPASRRRCSKRPKRGRRSVPPPARTCAASRPSSTASSARPSSSADTAWSALVHDGDRAPGGPAAAGVARGSRHSDVYDPERDEAVYECAQESLRRPLGLPPHPAGHVAGGSSPQIRGSTRSCGGLPKTRASWRPSASMPGTSRGIRPSGGYRRSVRRPWRRRGLALALLQNCFTDFSGEARRGSASAWTRRTRPAPCLYGAGRLCARFGATTRTIGRSMAELRLRPPQPADAEAVAGARERALRLDRAAAGHRDCGRHRLVGCRQRDRHRGRGRRRGGRIRRSSTYAATTCASTRAAATVQEQRSTNSSAARASMPRSSGRCFTSETPVRLTACRRDCLSRVLRHGDHSIRPWRLRLARRDRAVGGPRRRRADLLPACTRRRSPTQSYAPRAYEEWAHLYGTLRPFDPSCGSSPRRTASRPGS